MDTANPRIGNRMGPVRWLRHHLPEGRALPDDVWKVRHRFVLAFIFVHAVGLAIFGLVRGWSPAYAIGEGALIAMLGGIAMMPRLSRAFRSSVAALACVTSSAVLTQFMGGYIEGHFHYFVVVALIAMYQDWVPFLLAIVFVALNHGIIGSLMPEWVYNHESAIADPWTWGGIHAGLILAESVILIALWKSSELTRARTDLVLSSAGEGILGLDHGGRITFANPTAATMLDQPLEGLRGRPLEAVLQDAGIEASGSTGSTLPGVLANPMVAHGMALVERPTKRMPIDWTQSPIINHGQVDGSVLTIRDATMRIRAEAEQAKRVQQFTEIERLKELDKFKSLFINTAAHELHTPLTPLRLNIYALKEGHRGVLNPDQKETVDVLDRNVERMGRLVQDVLNVARLQANRLSIDKQMIDLGVIVDQAIASFQEPALAAEVGLETRVEAGLVVPADAGRLTQVLYNLLDNALKFTPKGGKIIVDAGRRGDDAYVRVRDTGVGLQKADIGRLFQPFVQAHSPLERTRAGSGLGLYISRGIIELHEGRITCKSDGPGTGACFEFTLPVDLPVTSNGSTVPVGVQAV